MQPVKISIMGNYYDCQIYYGRLYLWTFDGSLKIINWGKLIRGLDYYRQDKLSMRCCFMESNFLYKPDVQFLFSDKEYKNLMSKKLKHINGLQFIIDEKKLSEYLISEQDVHKICLPIDTEVYNNTLYLGLDNGLFEADLIPGMSTMEYAVNPKAKKRWDARIISMKANNYPQMALSCGDEGLYELSLQNEYEHSLQNEKTTEPERLSSDFSSFANYTYMSVYNSSLSGKCSMAEFSLRQIDKNHKKFLREKAGIIDSKSLFNSKEDAFSWGVQDKIYRVANGGFEVIKYNPYFKEYCGEQKFKRLRKFNCMFPKDKIISAGTALFGNILEYDDHLVVITNKEKEIYSIPGPITRWRIYPRSRYYLNQLHVILDDKIDIYSFNNDFFQNQSSKRIGIQYYQRMYDKKDSLRNLYIDSEDDDELPY